MGNGNFDYANGNVVESNGNFFFPVIILKEKIGIPNVQNA
jgi:hypothetical protein